ncbi:hypothetical protein Ae263Ps1_6374 [Pseudonocardia sp. Ae263_Ps1]|uniref:acyl carrier protein n=1 Tax=Pseudonocardia sp. Ae263_Ps1 TaxID=1885030 RepID=UPI00094B6D5F|nr:acyl carrier protein [Pseudonocardia sp. Ae263_Ps1]OLL70159.1 hypothetical protein Ae263Ps1_6374 [Pseudonocardia sp. Ae263_Ps1]
MSDSTFDTLVTILVEDFQLHAGDLSPAARCGEVGLDSLTAAELAEILRTHLCIEVHDYELLELSTLGDVAELLEQRRPTARRPG